jgi:4-aminobutyrate aminotransferase
MGGTYGGNAVAVAAALATLDVFEQEDILANVRARGQQLRQGLANIAHSIGNDGRAAVRDIRGLGLMVAIEFDPEQGAGVAAAVSAACLKRGLLLMTTGTRETLRFMPPLVITQEEVDECLCVLQLAMEECY